MIWCQTDSVKGRAAMPPANDSDLYSAGSRVTGSADDECASPSGALNLPWHFTLFMFQFYAFGSLLKCLTNYPLQTYVHYIPVKQKHMTGIM